MNPGRQLMPENHPRARRPEAGRRSRSSVGVRDDHADLGAGVELAGPQRGADPASLPPIMTRCMTGSLQVGCSVRRVAAGR
jgi:hypothetical protein